MRSSQIANKARTFRSGAYLDNLFRTAEQMDERLQAEICARIKQARVEAGFTQEEAADVLGMTQRGYQNYESIRVPFRKLTRIADVFNVAEKWILYGAASRDSAADDEGALLVVVRRLEELEGSVGRLDEKTATGFEALEAAISQLADQLRPPRQAGEA